MTQSRREAPRTRAAIVVTVTAFTVVLVTLVAPLVLIFVEALGDGWAHYTASIFESATLSSIRLTLFVVAIVVPLNAIFGLAAAWTVTRYEFPGKGFLTTLVDLPFTVSPVVSGLLFVLLFGARGVLGPTLQEHDIRIVYAVPGVLLATLFVTLPFVARELIPLLQTQGRNEEEAAVSLGARGVSILWRVTLPRIRWALFYGCVLCAARAAGEFGAVSVVSGHIRGETNTLPLHVEVLYNEYQFSAAFAVASVLALSGIFTLVLKTWLERRVQLSAQTGVETT